MRYQVIIKETVLYFVDVDASNEEQAKDVARENEKEWERFETVVSVESVDELY